MKMSTLYAALSGALLLGAATLVPAQTTPSEPAKARRRSSASARSRLLPEGEGDGTAMAVFLNIL